MQESVSSKTFLYHRGIETKIVKEINILESQGFKAISSSYRIGTGWLSGEPIERDSVDINEALSVLRSRRFKGYHEEYRGGDTYCGNVYHIKPKASFILEKEDKSRIELIVERPNSISELVESLKARFGFSDGIKKHKPTKHKSLIESGHQEENYPRETGDW